MLSSLALDAIDFLPPGYHLLFDGEPGDTSCDTPEEAASWSAQTHSWSDAEVEPTTLLAVLDADETVTEISDYALAQYTNSRVGDDYQVAQVAAELRTWTEAHDHSGASHRDDEKWTGLARASLGLPDLMPMWDVPRFQSVIEAHNKALGDCLRAINAEVWPSTSSVPSRLTELQIMFQIMVDDRRAALDALQQRRHELTISGVEDPLLDRELAAKCALLTREIVA